MTDLKKNFLYNVMYQILILILPFITTPYISRVLGAEGIGIYSYSYSVVSIFALLILLGINNYGNRTIAQNRDNKEKLSQKFLEIYSLQLIMACFITSAYIIYVLCFNVPNKIIAYIQIIYLLGTAMDINWFFFGIEKFKLTVIRNATIKIVSFICILLFVKEKSDVYIYTIIMMLSILLSNIFLIFNLKKYIKRVKITFKGIISHLKPCLVLFIPVIAFSIYRIMDKIMLGLMSNVTEVGFYENAEKIINIPLGIITAAGTVLLPRMSNMVSKGENISKYLDKTLKFILFISIPISFGLVAIADNFIPLFLGSEFIKTANLLRLLSFVIIIMSWSNIVKTIYLIPKERDKEYTISLIIGAIINLILNIILIPKINSYGAVIGTIFAELAAAVYQTYFIKENVKMSKVFKDASVFVISAVLMFMIVIQIPKLIHNSALALIIQIFVGTIIYLIANVRYINTLINIKYILKSKKIIKNKG